MRLETFNVHFSPNFEKTPSLGHSRPLHGLKFSQHLFFSPNFESLGGASQELLWVQGGHLVGEEREET